METKLRKIVLLRALNVGFWGGIIWGILFLIMYFFKMVEIDHIALFKKWFQDEWVNRWYAHVILLLILSICSMILAILYYFMLRKQKSWMVGAVYGMAIWFFVYFIIPLLTTGFNTFSQYEFETHLGILCNFILYGVFIGYTISYDYEHMRHELERNELSGEFQI